MCVFNTPTLSATVVGFIRLTYRLLCEPIRPSLVVAESRVGPDIWLASPDTIHRGICGSNETYKLSLTPLHAKQTDRLNFTLRQLSCHQCCLRHSLRKRQTCCFEALELSFNC